MGEEREAAEEQELLDNLDKEMKATNEFDWIKFHKDLDYAMAIFIGECMTYENKKILSDFDIIDLAKFSNEKRIKQKNK